MAHIPDMSSELDTLTEAIRDSVGIALFARMMGVSRQTVYNWRGRIPAERVIDAESITGISRRRLRPDLYRGDENGTRTAAED